MKAKLLRKLHKKSGWKIIENNKVLCFNKINHTATIYPDINTFMIQFITYNLSIVTVMNWHRKRRNRINLNEQRKVYKSYVNEINTNTTP